MGKQYAYCPNGYIEMIEKRTEDYEEEYPIQHFYHGSLLPYFKEIPEEQKEQVKLLWIWDEIENIFREPEFGEEIGGKIYIGLIPPERIYEVLQENLQLKTQCLDLENQLTDTQLALCEQYERAEKSDSQITDLQMALCEIYELLEGEDNG